MGHYYRKLAAGLVGWVGLATCLSPVAAHEFWIAPSDYSPTLGERVSATLNVGQMMSGTDLPFLSDRFDSFTITTSEGIENAAGNEGDTPALTYTAEVPGLHIIAHQATPHKLTYDRWEEFVEYLEYEGLGAIADSHRSRGLPESGFIEAYTRYAKALVQVGPVRAQDQDQSLGLALELVALANPYAQGINALPVKLTWRGAPLARSQISIFRRGDEVIRTTVVTDAQGGAEIPIIEKGEYLLNAVFMEPVTGGGDVAWQSHWASLTFEPSDQ